MIEVIRLGWPEGSLLAEDLNLIGVDAVTETFWEGMRAQTQVVYVPDAQQGKALDLIEGTSENWR